MASTNLGSKLCMSGTRTRASKGYLFKLDELQCYVKDSSRLDHFKSGELNEGGVLKSVDLSVSVVYLEALASAQMRTTRYWRRPQKPMRV